MGLGALAFGAGAFALALSGSGQAMRKADTQTSFRLHMRTHRGVVRRVEPNEGSTWWATVAPPEDRSRTQFFLDGEALPSTLQTSEAGVGGELASAAGEAIPFEVKVPGLGVGVHRIEARVQRRGERIERVTTSLIAGHYEPRGQVSQRCVAAISASPRALRRALVPPLREKLLAAVRGQPFLGDRPRVSQLDIELLERSVRVRVAIDGDNRLAVVARIDLRRAGDQRLSAGLAKLESVEFQGSARNWARGGGVGVGALLGGPLGAVAGFMLVEGVVDHKTREVVQTQIKKALSRASELELIPATLRLLPNESRSQVALAFCEDPQVDPQGVRVSFRIAPVGFPPSSDWPLEGPLVMGGELPQTHLRPGEDLRADLHLDLLNALLESWAATGMLHTRLLSSERLASVNEALAPWTPLRLAHVQAALPPMVSAFGAHDDADTGSPRVRVDWPMLGLGLEREDGVAVVPGERVDLSVRAWVDLVWEQSAGELRAQAGADAAWLGCASEAGATMTRRACFGTLG